MDNFAPNTRFINDSTVANIFKTVKKYTRYIGTKKLNDLPDLINNVRPEYDNCGIFIAPKTTIDYGWWNYNSSLGFNASNIFTVFNGYLDFNQSSIDINSFEMDTSHVDGLCFRGLKDVVFPNEFLNLNNLMATSDCFAGCKNLSIDYHNFKTNILFMQNMFMFSSINKNIIPYISGSVINGSYAFLACNNLYGYAYFDCPDETLDAVISTPYKRDWYTDMENIFVSTKNKNFHGIFHNSYGLNGVIFNFYNSTHSVKNNINITKKVNEITDISEIYNILFNSYSPFSYNSFTYRVVHYETNEVIIKCDDIKRNFNSSIVNLRYYGKNHMNEYFKYGRKNYFNIFGDSDIQDQNINVIIRGDEGYMVNAFEEYYNIIFFEVFNLKGKVDNLYFHNNFRQETYDLLDITTRIKNNIIKYKYHPLYKASYKNLNFYYGEGATFKDFNTINP